LIFSDKEHLFWQVGGFFLL